MSSEATVGQSASEHLEHDRLDAFEATLHEFTVMERFEMIERILRSLRSLAVVTDNRAADQKKNMMALLERLATLPIAGRSIRRQDP